LTYGFGTEDRPILCGTSLVEKITFVAKINIFDGRIGICKGKANSPDSTLLLLHCLLECHLLHFLIILGRVVFGSEGRASRDFGVEPFLGTTTRPCLVLENKLSCNRKETERGACF
jgi:hypothetical protein